MKHKSQSGLSLIGVMIGGAVLAALLLVGLKLIPVVSEYMGVKRSIAAVVAGANPQTATVSELRSAFSKRAMVDDVTTVIQGGASSVTALTGSTEEAQFH